MVQTWDIPSIVPGTTHPADDITRITNAFAALKSCFSGASLPTTNLVEGMFALDTTNNVYWRRDSVNATWQLFANASSTMVVAQSGVLAAGVSSFDKTYICTGTFVAGFADAATLTKGWRAKFRNDGSGAITLTPLAGQFIDGVASLVLLPGQSCEVSCDGAALHTIGLDQGSPCCTTGGTSTAFTITPPHPITAYAANQSFYVTFSAACGAAPTFAISGVATPPSLVRQNLDGSYVALAANDFPSGWQSRVTLVSTTQAFVEKLPPRTAIITATRDMTAAGGSVAYTGLTFKPRKITAYSGIPGARMKSSGIGNINSAFSSFSGVTSSYDDINTSLIAQHSTTAGAVQLASISSFDAGGVTLVWSKVGTPAAETANLKLFCEE